MSNNIDLYYFPASPPSRTVMLFAHALGLVCNMKMVNVIQGEQMKPEFLKLNPMHTVPTIDDNGYVLWESQAIMKYLADKFDKEGKFKTHDPQGEARVNQLLFFDATTLFPRLMDYVRPVALGNEQPNNEKLSKVEEALSVLNTMLAKDKYTGVPKLTFADFALATSISTAEGVQIDIGKYPNIKSWLERMKKEMPGYNDLNQKGTDMIAAGFKARAG